jgi:hypothetical protein
MNAEKENTFRAIGDKPLIVTSWLCRFGIHRWEQWSDPYIPKNGQSNIQTRACIHCNEMEVVKLRFVKGRDAI